MPTLCRAYPFVDYLIGRRVVPPRCPPPPCFSLVHVSSAVLLGKRNNGAVNYRELTDAVRRANRILKSSVKLIGLRLPEV